MRSGMIEANRRNNIVLVCPVQGAQHMLKLPQEVCVWMGFERDKKEF